MPAFTYNEQPIKSAPGKKRLGEAEQKAAEEAAEAAAEKLKQKQRRKRKLGKQLQQKSGKRAQQTKLRRNAQQKQLQQKQLQQKKRKNKHRKFGEVDVLVEELCLGVIIGPHGIKGTVRVKGFTEIPEVLQIMEPCMTRTERVSIFD